MKERLDVMLVNRGLVESREKAKAVIMAGEVFVDGQREDKAGSMFKEECRIELHGTPMKYVSRGGYKLEKMVKLHEIQLAEKVCMDVGSSTGGFTDCMLQNGAQKVYAVDVGTNQLVWKLRNDKRVISLEKTNIRNVNSQMIPERIDFVTIDVSFISLRLVLPPVKALLSENAELVCLIKPQFEAGREKVGKKGIVREAQTHFEVLQTVLDFTCEIGFEVKDVTFSPIRGMEGNIEFLMYLRNVRELSNRPSDDTLQCVVSIAHENLKKQGMEGNVDSDRA